MKIKHLIALLTIIVCIFALCSFTYGENKYISDPDGLVSDADEAQIASALADAEARAGIPVRAYVYKYKNRYKDIDDYEAEVGEKYNDIALLVVSYEYGTYYYELFVYGKADAVITTNESDRILDNPDVYNGIKSGRLKDGIIAYADLSATAIEGALRPDFGKTLLRAFIIAFIGALITVLIIFFKYKKKLHSESYPLERYARLDLRIAHDTFITKHVTRVRIRTSSSGGGGSRSGGGRSGGSRGRR